MKHVLVRAQWDRDLVAVQGTEYYPDSSKYVTCDAERCGTLDGTPIVHTVGCLAYDEGEQAKLSHPRDCWLLIPQND